MTAKKKNKKRVRKVIKAMEPDVKAIESSDLIDMHEAIDILKTSRPTFYRWLRTGKIKGMKIGRQWRFYREDIERFLKGKAPRIDLPADIKPLIQTLRKRVKKIGVVENVRKDINKVQLAIDLMIVLGVTARASDIHITPYLSKGSAEIIASVQLRIDGVLQQIAGFDVRLVPAIMKQMKRMANCDVHEKSKPQDGRILTNLSELNPGTQEKVIDMRVGFLPTGLGESVTIRILDSTVISLSLDELDHSAEDRDKLQSALKAPWGIILITGPTGSGKTTVLYSCLNELAGPEIKTISVEDPIEFFLPWVAQVSVNVHEGLTFSNITRAIFRSDPDVILIGEIRDLDTLSAAHEAALTGHLVLTTMHVDKATNALSRMVDIGSDPFVVAESTKLVLSQCLVRKLCPDCSVEYTPEPDQLDLAFEIARRGGIKRRSLPKKYRVAVGCEKCAHTGYRRRSVISEVLVITPEIGKALRNNASAEELRSIAIKQGMTTISADGIRRFANGETSLDEVIRVTEFDDL